MFGLIQSSIFCCERKEILDINVKMFSLLKTAGNSATKIGMRGAVLNRCQLSTSAYAMSKLIYTECDEAPMLATFSLLPVIQRFAKPMGIEVSVFLSFFYLAAALQRSKSHKQYSFSQMLTCKDSFS